MNPVPSGAVEIDARGMKCPWPALRAARAMRETGSEIGGVIVRADDPIAETELRALAAQWNWTFTVIGKATFHFGPPAVNPP